MAKASKRSGKAWRATAAVLLLAAAAAVAGRPAAAGDTLHIQQLPENATGAFLQMVVELAIVQPEAGRPPYLGAAPLKVQVVMGGQPARVIFAFERAKPNGGWQALGTLETGWQMVPATIPGSFLQSSGLYRVRAASADPQPQTPQGGRVVTPVERNWSPWIAFNFRSGNSLPGGMTAAPITKLPTLKAAPNP